MVKRSRPASSKPYGAIYVPIDTLSKALGVTLTIKSNEPPPAAVAPPRPALLATVPVAAPPLASAPAPVVTATTTTVTLTVPPHAAAAPSITGKLTYYLNLFNTSAPDSGAQVWLVNEASVAALAAAAGGMAYEPIPPRAVGWDAKLTGNNQFPHRVADSHGEFVFEDVAPGAYLAIYRSTRVNGLALRDRQGKMRFKKILVQPGVTVDASLNFGVTAYKD